MKKKIFITISLVAVIFTLTACSNNENNTVDNNQKTETKNTDKSDKSEKQVTKYLDAIKDMSLKADSISEPTFDITKSGVSPKETVGFIGESDTKMAIYVLNSEEDTNKLSDYFLDNNEKVYYDSTYKYVLVSESKLTDKWFNKYRDVVSKS